MPRDNSSKRMWRNRENLSQIVKDFQLDSLMWERRYNTCVDGKEKLYQQLDECIDMLDRVLMHVDLDDVNPSMKKQIQTLLDKVRNRSKTKV